MTASAIDTLRKIAAEQRAWAADLRDGKRLPAPTRAQTVRLRTKRKK